MTAFWETPNYEPNPNDVVNGDTGVDTGVDANADDSIAKFNNNPELAQVEADRIAEWLPSTLQKLSTDQQKLFAKEVWQKLTLINIWENVENVPDVLPEGVIKDLQTYAWVRSNFAKLPPDQQKLLRDAEKSALEKMTTDSKATIGQIDTGMWGTMWGKPIDTSPSSGTGEAPQSVSPVWDGAGIDSGVVIGWAVKQIGATTWYTMWGKSPSRDDEPPQGTSPAWDGTDIESGAGDI